MLRGAGRRTVVQHGEACYQMQFWDVKHVQIVLVGGSRRAADEMLRYYTVTISNLTMCESLLTIVNDFIDCVSGTIWSNMDDR